MAVSSDKTRIQITIPKNTKKELKKKASDANRSVSNYVLNLILKDLEK